MIILAGTKPEHLNMLEGGIIAKLLDEKWNTFAKVIVLFLIGWIGLCFILIKFNYNNSFDHFPFLDDIFQEVGEGLDTANMYIGCYLCPPTKRWFSQCRNWRGHDRNIRRYYKVRFQMSFSSFQRVLLSLNYTCFSDIVSRLPLFLVQ